MTDLPVLTSPLLLRLAGVRHAFFTRNGGASSGIYESLNVGLGSKDDPVIVNENRARIARHFDLDPSRLVTAYQVHSATALLIEEEAGLTADPKQPGDALVTDLTGVACGALSADCAPVLLADPNNRVIAAVHAGWKGALAGITDMTLTAMVKDFGAVAENIVAAVGPCIGPASYEVDQDFLERFAAEDPGSERFFSPGVNASKRMFNLPGYVLDRLAKAGVRQAEWIGADTYANADRFFSNRRTVHRGEADYGRLMSAIALA